MIPSSSYDVSTPILQLKCRPAHVQYCEVFKSLHIGESTSHSPPIDDGMLVQILTMNNNVNVTLSLTNITDNTAAWFDGIADLMGNSHVNTSIEHLMLEGCVEHLLYRLFDKLVNIKVLYMSHKSVTSNVNETMNELLNALTAASLKRVLLISLATTRKASSYILSAHTTSLCR